MLAFTRFGDNYLSYESYLDHRDEIDASNVTLEAEQLRNDADTHIISSDDDDFADGYDPINSNIEPDESLPPIIVETINQSSTSMDGLANQFGQSIGSDNFQLQQVNIDFQQFHEAADGNVHDPNDENSLLPIRIKCAAHSLNLVGKTDATKALADQSYAQIYCQSISKLNLLWKYCGYRKSSDDIKKYVGSTLR